MKNDNQDKELNKSSDEDIGEISGGYVRENLFGRHTYCDACDR